MSAKKEFEVDENTDSGFLSGPLSEQLESCDDAVEVTKDNVSKTVGSVDLGLSECFSKVSLSERPTQQAPIITIEDKDLSPIALLFQQDDEGDTQLHTAAVHGCERSTGILIRLCPNKALLDVCNDYGHTALHLAAMSGHKVVTRMLVIAGASLHVRDVTGSTALHYAAAAGHIECINALLAPVPEHSSMRRLSALLNQKDYNGQTCVHLAAAKGHLEALQTLVFFGADINVQEGLCGWTALHIAASNSNLHLAQYLVDKCPGVMVQSRDYAGRTPFRLAARNGAARAFKNCQKDWDSDSDSEDDDMLYESEQSLYEKLRDDGMNMINVA